MRRGDDDEENNEKGIMENFSRTFLFPNCVTERKAFFHQDLINCFCCSNKSLSCLPHCRRIPTETNLYE